MKIPFKMPLELPQGTHIEFSVRTAWTSRKLNDSFKLEIFFGNETISRRKAHTMYKAICAANAPMMSSSFSDEESPYTNEYRMVFEKRGVGVEQDKEDCSIFIWPPDDPIEWLK